MLLFHDEARHLQLNSTPAAMGDRGSAWCWPSGRDGGVAARAGRGRGAWCGLCGAAGRLAPAPSFEWMGALLLVAAQ